MTTEKALAMKLGKAHIEALRKQWGDDLYPCSAEFYALCDMALSALSLPETVGEPVAWADWKVGSSSYAPFRTLEEAQRSVRQSSIAATQDGPYEVVALVPLSRAAPPSQPAQGMVMEEPSTELRAAASTACAEMLAPAAPTNGEGRDD